MQRFRFPWKTIRNITIKKFSSVTHKSLRNVGIIAHIDAGKTTTTEQMLFLSGQTKYIGRVDTGDTVMDFLPQERERGITIQSAAISFPWKQHQINLIDTPGHVDFTVEVERSVRVLDGTVLIIDAIAGVQAQTRTVWKQATKNKVPAICFVNKMDREGADFTKCLESVKQKLGVNPIPIQIPLTLKDDFDGVVDLISLNKITWVTSPSRSTSEASLQPLTVTDACFQDAIVARESMLESIAEIDEVFMETYLETVAAESYVSTTEDITATLKVFPEGLILDALRRACVAGVCIPVLCGASLRGKGVGPLLDSICAFLPSPSDRPAQLMVPSTSSRSNEFSGRGGEGRGRGRANDNGIQVSAESSSLCAMAFKVEVDPMRGLMVYIRTFSGSLHLKKSLFNSTRQKKERILHLYRIYANDLVHVDALGPGDVGCVVGLKYTVTGDTLVEEKGDLQNLVLEGFDLPMAVYSLAIEPEKSSQQPELESALQVLCLEDPSLRVVVDNESGQTLLRGIGELHLEIICDKLKRRFGIAVETGKAYVAYRESLEENFNEPKIEHTYDRSFGNKRMFAGVTASVSSNGTTEPCVVDIEKAARSSISNDEYAVLLDALEGSLSRGPRGFPVVGLRVVVLEIHRDQDTTSGSIRACVSTLIDSLLRGKEHILMEPVMSLEVDAPTQFLGDVLSDISAVRRGVVKEVVPGRNRNIIHAEVPLAMLLGYATVIRSMTQGEGSFSLEYLHHSPTADVVR